MQAHQQDKDMADKAILVTGGGSGIGRASALLLAQAGARVAVADQSLSAATETAMMIRDAGGDALGLQADVSDEHSVMLMID